MKVHSGRQVIVSALPHHFGSSPLTLLAFPAPPIAGRIEGGEDEEEVREVSIKTRGSRTWS